MIRIKAAVLAALLVGASQAQTAEGSCGHNEMRHWVNQEEICHQLYGVRNERWSLANQFNLGTLADCLDTARDAYYEARMICEMRGETAYREDRIHVDWSRYRTAYKFMQQRIEAGH